MAFESDVPESLLRQQGKRAWKALMVTGLIMLTAGISATLLPFVATLTIELLLGVILIIASVLHIFHAVTAHRPKSLLLEVAAAGLYGLAGLLLLTFPLGGMLTLTSILAVLFVLAGALKIAISWQMRPINGWGWLMFNGIVALALGGVIWAGLPQAATWAIGLLVGIELLFSGWVVIVLACAVRDEFSNQDTSRELELIPKPS